jgi:hypothetical protein
MTMLTTIVAYLVSAMLAWAPTSNHAMYDANQQVTRDRYNSIATDIAAVAMDPAEPPLFEGENGRVETALVLLSVAFWESGFAARVDDGHCRPGECDGGLAVSLWQIHPDEGIVMDGDVYTYARNRSSEWRDEHASEILHRSDLRDRKTAARVALHIMRYSMQRGAGLCNYTGEVSGGCPKARVRLNFATRWAATHPFTGSEE